MAGDIDQACAPVTPNGSLRFFSRFFSSAWGPFGLGWAGSLAARIVASGLTNWPTLHNTTLKAAAYLILLYFLM